jgi:hypothetical protein
MNSDEFDAHFIDAPRLTASEITAFLAAWTVLGRGPVGPTEPPVTALLAALTVVGPVVPHEDPPVDELIELITLLAAGHTECAPPERGEMRRRLRVRIEQKNA